MGDIGITERDLGDLDGYVEVEGKDEDTATLLLDAQEALDLPVEVVRTTSDGFLVPEKVAKRAGVKYEAPEVADYSAQESEAEAPKQAPAKKAPAKKAAAKKAPAKKAGTKAKGV